MDKLELVGQKEIAEMCGVSQPAVAEGTQISPSHMQP
jgi:predicted transcriptional regulator